MGGNVSINICSNISCNSECENCYEFLKYSFCCECFNS